MKAWRSIGSLLILALGCGAPIRGGRGHDGGGGGGQGGGPGGWGGGGAGGGTGGGAGGAGSAKCGAAGGATFGGASNPWKNPEIQCQWSPPGGDVVTTPLVIDLDGDGKPEIVFQSASNGCGDRMPTVLYAIRGDDCTEVWSVPAALSGCTQLAAGDLDSDGKPEIVGYERWARILRVYDRTGKLVATSEAIPGPIKSSMGFGSGTAPAIADVDGAPPAEVVINATVLRLESGALKTLWSKPYDEGYWGALSLVADVDLDGAPDLVSGNRIFDAATGAVKTPTGFGMIGGGYPAVAQFDKSTAEPEIVLVTSQFGWGEIRILSPSTGAVWFGPYTLPSDSVKTGIGGGPVVADFDGDKEPEVGVAGPHEYRVYDPECAASPLPARCAEPGVLWKSTTDDDSSGGTSSSVFDFNNDCQGDVVYRDECWLRIYDGKTGKVVSAFAITSGTALEEPIIADVDGDGHAEIVVSSDRAQEGAGFACAAKAEEHTGAPWTGYTHGVFVLRDSASPERWAPARRVWNQNTYHVTNVNEDGTVPAKEKSSWDAYNGYRQNARP